MKRISLISMLLACAMSTLTISATAAETDWLVEQVKTYDGRFEDDNAWCADAMQTVYEAGLMEGKTATRFDISSPLTNAQITVVTARLHHLLNGGDGVLPPVEAGQAWYQSAVDYLKDVSEDETLLYLLKRLETDAERSNSPCIRRDFVWMLSAVLPEDSLSPINEINVIPDVGSNEAELLPFYRAGILNGSDAYGTFGEETFLTRGAAAAIMARLVDPAQRLTFTLQSFDLCRDVLGVEPDTVLLTVDGKEVPAALFAEQLCTSLYQWEGTTSNALNDAIRFWCDYQGCFHEMAEELELSIPAEKQSELQHNADEQAGYLGLPAAYWQFRSEGIHLNGMMNDLYYEQDWKTGANNYHRDLANIAETMKQTATPTTALESMNLDAVYERLMKSPFIQWNF